jgi:hypothetical protein
LQIGDYIAKADGSTNAPGKIVDEDNEMWVIEWGQGKIGVIQKTTTDYVVIATGDPSRGWANKQK